VIKRIEVAMRDKGLFRDADLSLDRLARRLGLPARRVSAAVNRVHGQNVSQYVNGFRIAEACKLLAGTDKPVLQIMLDAGFETKSNFNREFRRISGMSPVEWRAKHRP
jgi:AraC-like DNA-binding protein